MDRDDELVGGLPPFAKVMVEDEMTDGGLNILQQLDRALLFDARVREVQSYMT